VTTVLSRSVRISACKPVALSLEVLGQKANTEATTGKYGIVHVEGSNPDNAVDMLNRNNVPGPQCVNTDFVQVTLVHTLGVITENL